MSKKYQKLSNSRLRSVVSDVLPYELPLVFNTLALHKFLRSTGFRWEQYDKFSVKHGLDKGSKAQLKILFGIEHADSSVWGNNGVFETVTLKGKGAGKLYTIPHRFEITGGKGKTRTLSLIHPRAMVELAGLIDKFEESVLYYCNRSKFSLRHPVSKARLTLRLDSELQVLESTPERNLELHNREYEQVSSHFKYVRYNNINAYYDSAEFRACERKYSYLLLADVAKCFDSIYTHSIAWVTNGLEPSKKNVGRKSNYSSFGDAFDKGFQKVNYNETNGICIGPEISRIFAEIILQEIDVLTYRSLEKDFPQLALGIDYEVLRYVDDYFIFASSENIARDILTSLRRNLATYKLQINEAKTEGLDTPLASGLTVAKNSVRESLAKLVRCNFVHDSPEDFDLFLSTDDAIRALKRILLETDQELSNVANYYLSILVRKIQKVVRLVLDHWKYCQGIEYFETASKLTTQTAKFLFAGIDVAFFVYSGFPTESQSLKLCEMLVLSLGALKAMNVSPVDLSSFRDKVRREVVAQLNSARDASSFGVHTLNLIDCLTHFGMPLGTIEILKLIERRGQSIQQLDAISILILLRACGSGDSTMEMRRMLLEQSARICMDAKRETESAILKLSIPHCLYLNADEVKLGTGISKKNIEAMRNTQPCSFISWGLDSDNEYYKKLVQKRNQMVY